MAKKTGEFRMIVKFNGIDEYRAKGDRAADSAAEAAVKLGAQVAQSKAPVLTGALKASIDSEHLGPVYRIVAEAPYAVYQEMGIKKRGMKGHGFVKAGSAAAIAAWTQLLDREMKG